MKKFKKLKRVIALILLLSITATTNLNGFQNTLKIEASTTTTEIEAKETYDGLEWVFKGTKTNGVVTNTSTSLSNNEKYKLSNRSVTVPNTIGGYNVTVLDANIFKGSDLTSLKINNPNLVILDSICEKCDKLESVDITCKSFALENDFSPSYAFYDCDALKKANVCSTQIQSLAFYGCDSLEELNLSSPTNTLTISSQTFGNCTSLKNVTFSDKLTKINFGNYAFNANNNLESLVIPGNVSIGQESFSQCIKLKNVEFLGQVTSMEKGAFKNSFLIEEKDGKQITKTITFKDSVVTSENAFINCEGLTNVVLSSNSNVSNRFFGNNIFENCKSLSDIDFGEGRTQFYGDSIFNKCPKFKNLNAKNLTFTYGYGKSLLGSSIENLEIYGNTGSGSTLYIDQGTEKLPLKRIVIGKDYVDGKINFANLSDLQSIVFTNPNMISCNLTTSNSSKAMVYGYKSSVSSGGTTSATPAQSWASANKLSFQSIVSGLKTSYTENIIGTTDINSIDKSKFIVTAEKSYLTNSLNSEIIAPSTNGSDLTGYVLILPDKLVYGENDYKVIYGGETARGTFQVIEKKPVSINVDWKENEISELVSNQPIESADVISGACITYNNGDTEIVTADKLTLNKTITVAGDNTFIATLTGTDIEAEKTFTIKKNYITSIEAKYDSNETLYVGDKIDINKVKITPIYKYDKDKTVNRNITDFKISDTELKKTGENEFVVSYNNLQATIILSADAVVPTNIYAIFDNNCTYIEGQEIDPKIIAVTIEYNNGIKKSGSEINYAYDIEVKTVTDKNIQVLISYQGCSTTVDIPVTPKEVKSIKANAKIASAVEGTTLDKTIIDKIEITYNNGKTETLDERTINYENLSFNDYTILANQNNIITVNYAGKTSDITIFGVSNSITGIYAEYIGRGQTIGTIIPVSDVAVHAINANGQITDITSGILLENAIPYNVGINTVIVHYGAFTCQITVTGLPVSSISPNPSTAPTNVPKQTEKPTVSETPTQPNPTPTQPSNTVVIITPDNPNGAPAATNTDITVKSNNSKLYISTNKTYKVYTNQNITFTVTAVSASTIKYQVVAKGSKLTAKGWKNISNNKITVSKTAKASIVYIQYTDKNGIIKNIHTNGFTIDKKPATVNVKKNKTYKKGKKITFKDSSGISSAKLNSKKIKSGTTIKKVGTYKLVIIDNAGNKKSISFKIK